MDAIPAPMRHSGIMMVWRVACESLGYYDVRLHDLRHCHGQSLIDAGVSEQDVKRSLRHKTVGMTRRYTRRKEIKNVAVAMAGVLAPTSALGRARRSSRVSSSGPSAGDVGTNGCHSRTGELRRPPDRSAAP